MTKFCIVLCLFAYSLGYAQYNFDFSNKSTKELVTSIAKKNELLSNAVGMGGTPTAQYARFEELKKKASREELIRLTKHENPVVRCYAFWGLSDKKEKNLLQVLLDRLNDTTKVSRQFGCVTSYVSVADFSVELLTRKYLFTDDYYRENISQLTIPEKRILDSVVLYEHSNLTYLEHVLSNHKPNKNDYNRIKEIVISGNYTALPALAKYQKEEDISLILSFKDVESTLQRFKSPKEFLFNAIENFPHSQFKEYLLGYFKINVAKKYSGENSFAYYNAVIKYNDNFSFDVIDAVRNNYREDSQGYDSHIRYLNMALGKYPSKGNQQFIYQIWSEFQLIEKESFMFLAKNQPDKTFTFLKNYMRDFEKVYQGRREEEQISAMLDFGLNYNKEETIELIAKNLKTNSVTPFREFKPYAIKLKSEKFIEPLFYRIENEWNSYVVFDAIDIILSYNRKDLNDRILPASRKNNKIVDKYTSRKNIESAIQKKIKKQ